jgi:hypothetical protein
VKGQQQTEAKGGKLFKQLPYIECHMTGTATRVLGANASHVWLFLTGSRGFVDTRHVAQLKGLSEIYLE